MGENIGKERDKHWNKTGKKLGAKGGTEIESRGGFTSASWTSALTVWDYKVWERKKKQRNVYTYIRLPIRSIHLKT